jgi:hypothetical protein
MNYLYNILPHIIFNLYFTYNFYKFLLICIINNAIWNIDAHIHKEKIMESNNLIFKLFIYKNYVMSSINQRLYYSNIELSKYRLYNLFHDCFIRIITSIDETIMLIIKLFKLQLSSVLTLFFMSDHDESHKPAPLNINTMITQILPLMLKMPGQPRQSGQLGQPIQTPRPIQKVPLNSLNSLTYDSDDDSNIDDLISVD